MTFENTIPANIFAKLKRSVRDNLDKIYQEITETKELYELLLKWSTEGSLTAREQSAVKTQLLDICKTIPALAVFLVPFGSVLLALLIKYLPFNILPDAFSDSSQIK